ncbi:MAG: hypothetical protein J6J36_02905 [Clostridia bacterium]|nr:hypothetical protein [Clostridia bacterium]
MKNSFYDLFKMMKERKIRNGDILVVYSKTDDEFIDYYAVQEKDFIWLLCEKTERIWLFDNFFVADLLDNYCFKVVFKDKEKQEIFNKLGL